MTWEPGDVALCIQSGAWIEPYTNRWTCIGPKKNQFVTVRKAFHVPPFGYGLLFKEFPGNEESDAYSAKYFRKIPPLTRDERDQFLADLDYDADVLALQRMYQQ